MLNFVRNHQRWLQFILLLLILPAFVLTGVASFNGSSSDNVVAKVGAREISQQEFSSRYQDLINNARQQEGAQFDISRYQTPEIRSVLLTQMADEVLLEELLKKGQMAVTDQELIQALARIPGMPKTEQGTIDMEAYKQVLAEQQTTPAMHQQALRIDLLKQQMNPAYSVLPLPYQNDFISKFFGRMRTIELKSVDLTPYMEQANITPEQLQAYYDQNKAQFATQDSYDIEYAKIPVSSTNASASQITDADIKEAFGADATPEQLAKVRQDPNQSKAVLEQVVQKRVAAQLDGLIAKSPQDVATVVKSFNVSVQQVKNMGTQVDENTPDFLQQANIREILLNSVQADSKKIAPVTALPSGDLLVARVTQYRAAGTRSFDEVKADIEQQLRREAAVAKAAEDAQSGLAAQSASNSIGAPISMTWVSSSSPLVTPAIAAKSMGMPANQLPALAVVTDKARVDVIRVVKEDALPAQELARLNQLGQQIWYTPNQDLTYSAYMSALRERAGVKLYPERIRINQN